ncbi:MAG: 4-hydroxythreonine-4-phosphate dehydrogenase PdxA [Candidatus Kapabacteria bacterium]|nr:4-hydroxythreonine-4-phosphate dehydrogenase PdxA [Candidatus Kapabacteria bacterium]
MNARLSVSCGDVNGIGLRCFADACSQHPFSAVLELAIDDTTLARALSVYQLPGVLRRGVWRLAENSVVLIPINTPSDVFPGTLQDDAALCALSSLNTSIARTVDGNVDALVTLPINKYGLTRVGWTFPGQTEMVAAAAGGEPLMILCTRDVRVALATVHVPLSDVTSRLTIELIVARIAALHHHLVVDLGLIDPQIAILSIDPHAGEHGVIGTTDDSVVRPAIELARASEYQVDGPHAADGFFAFGAYKRYDGIVAMYHDQGLIPLKLLAQGAGVNCTAGLNIIRTSPDHGTAYDVAAGGDVDAQSTIEAIELSIRIVRNRRTFMH